LYEVKVLSFGFLVSQLQNPKPELIFESRIFSYDVMA